MSPEEYQNSLLKEVRAGLERIRVDLIDLIPEKADVIGEYFTNEINELSKQIK